ncbi:SWIM zinc finger family protein [Streptomyces sp. NPDC005303]|uniref:SWIM zinc finger family protein n=1 Tax=Streptomyces sp. NPDC005303 TaxID=3155713 RepID=UPI0033A73D67
MGDAAAQGLGHDAVQGSESRADGGSGGSAAQGAGGAVRGGGRLAVEGGGRLAEMEEGDSAAQGAGSPAATGADRLTAEGAARRVDVDADEPRPAGGEETEGATPENAVADPAPAEPRPGDAARAALREAVAARRAALGDGATGRSGTGSGGAASGADGLTQSRVPRPEAAASDPADATGRSDAGAAPRTSARSTAGEADRVTSAALPAADALDALDAADAPDAASAGLPGARPADAAREALRTARRRRADAEAAEAEAVLARRSRRTTPTASGNRARGRTSPSPAVGARARDVRELLSDAFRMPDDVAQPGEGYEDKAEDNSGTWQGSSLQEAPAPADAPLNTGVAARSDAAQTDAASPTPAAEATASDRHPLPPTPAPFPSTPRRPHSMAAPNRDSDLRRTFPAFPPHVSEDARFAATWWGNAWVAALEEGALDAKRLARGRGYAEQGHVDAITVTPGLVLAYVQGSRARPYRVQVRLRTLGDADWDRFLDLAADRTGHIAALLDKEMPEALAECGVPLLPGPGDLEPQCSCPDRGHPCKHAAALCYQTARLLDADPFVLLLLRGRGERDLLDALSRLSAARAARAAQEHEPAPLSGVRASEALAPRRLPPLPAPLPVPSHPGQPPAYPASPGGPDPFALDQLATDAAARAHALLGTGRDPVGELTLWQDVVRLAAARPGSGLTAGTRALYASLAAATERTPADLARAVAAWRQGGLEGLAVLEEPWDPPAGRFDRARPLLLGADLPAFRPWRNHLTHPRGHIQLRLGRDGLWYAYESEPGHDDWWPRGTPDLDPVGALTGLGTPTDL